MLFLSRADVEARLDLDALIDALAPAMADLSSGARLVARPDRGAGARAGRVPRRDARLRAVDRRAHGQAGVAVPAQRGTDLPTHQALIVAFDPETGEPVAVMDGTAITAIRTGAGSALSARLLARPDASVLAILGTGCRRGRTRGPSAGPADHRVRIAGRDPAKARALADELADLAPTGARRDGLRGRAGRRATSPARPRTRVEPVVRREWLDPGTHVTSVGFNAAGREVDDATVADALLVVESRAAALAPLPAVRATSSGRSRAGIITGDLPAELGEIVSGTRPGAPTPTRSRSTSRSASRCRTRPPLP